MYFSSIKKVIPQLICPLLKSHRMCMPPAWLGQIWRVLLKKELFGLKKLTYRLAHFLESQIYALYVHHCLNFCRWKLTVGWTLLIDFYTNKCIRMHIKSAAAHQNAISEESIEENDWDSLLYFIFSIALLKFPVCVSYWIAKLSIEPKETKERVQAFRKRRWK